MKNNLDYDATECLSSLLGDARCGCLMHSIYIYGVIMKFKETSGFSASSVLKKRNIYVAVILRLMMTTVHDITLLPFWLIWVTCQLGLYNWKVTLMSLILVSVYSAPGHMVDAIDLISSTYMHIYLHLCSSNIWHA